MTEKEKMQQGLLYQVLDEELQNLEAKAKELLYRYNHAATADVKLKTNVLEDLFGTFNSDVYIVPEFMCIFGFNIHFEGKAVINSNCSMLDSAPIRLGQNVFVGPGTCFAAASHPLIAEERNADLCYAKPITIGKDVWIGTNCSILGGITIGDESVIGAGSVVTKDIPAGVIAVGNPCRVVREITESDRMVSTDSLINR